MTRLLEELSLSALPALQTSFLDGWVLRLSDNFTRRANSVNPLYPSLRPLEVNIADAEAIYRERGQRVVFKITPASLPEGLDQELANREYVAEATTAVQTADLSGRPIPARSQVVLLERLSTEWLEAVFALNSVPERHQRTMQEILSRVAPRTCFASLRIEDKIVSLGMGVLEAGWLGLYDLVTAPEYRGRGYAHQIINGLLAWAMPLGARNSYLQVMTNNEPALRLYDGLGFKEQYQYWYRVKG